MLILVNFLFCRDVRPRDLHSFPTRRSSDLLRRRVVDAQVHALDLRPEGHVGDPEDRKSTRLNSSHMSISYARYWLKKKTLTDGDLQLEAIETQYARTRDERAMWCAVVSSVL